MHLRRIANRPVTSHLVSTIDRSMADCHNCVMIMLCSGYGAVRLARLHGV